MALDPIGLTVRVAELLDSLDIPYLLGGALASAILGEPRATEDVDIVADIRPEQAEAVIRVLGNEFYVPAGRLRDAVSHRTSFNVIHLETMRKVDIFVLRALPLDQQEMARRRLTVVTTNPDRSIYVASPEDLVLQKLDWYRCGEGVSDRQWRDVLGLLKVQADRIDRAYLRRWADVIQVTDLLERACREAGFPSSS
jgi:hypothetical protein